MRTFGEFAINGSLILILVAIVYGIVVFVCPALVNMWHCVTYLAHHVLECVAALLIAFVLLGAAFR